MFRLFFKTPAEGFRPLGLYAKEEAGVNAAIAHIRSLRPGTSTFQIADEDQQSVRVTAEGSDDVYLVVDYPYAVRFLGYDNVLEYTQNFNDALLFVAGHAARELESKITGKLHQVGREQWQVCYDDMQATYEVRRS